MRDQGGLISIEAGDAFVFKPNERHQILNDRAADPIVYVVADYPVFRLLGERYRNRRKRFGLRLNLIAALTNLQ